MATLIIEAGHDPKFQGSAGEVDWVRQVIAELRNFCDFTLVPDGLGGGTGNGNLINKINWINQNSGPNDFLISVHENAGGGTGNEVWYFGGSDYSKNKAITFSEFMKETTGRPNRNAHPDTSNRWGRLGIIRDTEPSAWLVEAGFGDAPGNADEAVGPKAYARGIAKFIQHLGFPVRNLDAPAPAPTPVPAPVPGVTVPPSEFYRLFGPDGNQIGAYTNNLAQKVTGLESTNAALVIERDKAVEAKNKAKETADSINRQLDEAFAEIERLKQTGNGGKLNGGEEVALANLLKKLIN